MKTFHIYKRPNYKEGYHWIVKVKYPFSKNPEICSNKHFSLYNGISEEWYCKEFSSLENAKEAVYEYRRFLGFEEIEEKVIEDKDEF
jgi:hypothetical protein